MLNYLNTTALVHSWYPFLFHLLILVFLSDRTHCFWSAYYCKCSIKFLILFMQTRVAFSNKRHINLPLLAHLISKHCFKINLPRFTGWIICDSRWCVWFIIRRVADDIFWDWWSNFTTGWTARTFWFTLNTWISILSHLLFRYSSIICICIRFI